jgi:hypothetical protein
MNFSDNTTEAWKGIISAKAGNRYLSNKTFSFNISEFTALDGSKLKYTFLNFLLTYGI